jgi:hypothetical protein
MAFAKISTPHRDLLIMLRTVQDQSARKRILKNVFGEIKRNLGIPEKHRLKVELDNASSPDYLVLIRKKGGEKYKLGVCGRWVDAPPVAVPRALVSIPVAKLIALAKDAQNNGDTFTDAPVDLPDGVKAQMHGDNLIIDLG